jgi:hypothetical protein
VFEPSSRAGTSRASLDRQRPGFSPLVGAINQRLDNGWHVTFGAGYNFSNRFGVAGQFMYNGLGVSRGVLQEFSVPDGNANVWSITAEPRINFAPRRRFTPYVIGGVGYYRRTVEFTQPALAQTVVFDPFFGFVPVTVQVNQVLGTFVRDGIGGSAGLGFDAPVRGEGGPKFFTEVRFHYSDAGGIPLRMVPVTLGLRFWNPPLCNSPHVVRYGTAGLANSGGAVGKCFSYQVIERLMLSTTCFDSRIPCPSRG